MNLCIDIGNTRIKLGIFKNNTLTDIEYCDEINEEHIRQIIAQNHIQSIVYSNVRSSVPAIFAVLAKQCYVLEINQSTQLPIQNAYQTPHTLGKDRLSAVVGAYNIFPQTHVMVLGAGTALTIDYLHENGTYLGGNISLGMQMRFKALHQFTGQLPLVEPSEQFVICGTNTTQALVAGVQQGMIHEMEGYIDAFLKQSPTGKVILSGGDGFFFENKIKRTIFARPNLVLEGLHRILIYNEKN